MEEDTIELGDTVRDYITGFEGIVIGRTKWLYGCERMVVQPTKLSDKGELGKPETFDMPQLVLVLKTRSTIPGLEPTAQELAEIGAAVEKAIPSRKGGPHPNAERR